MHKYRLLLALSLCIVSSLLAAALPIHAQPWPTTDWQTSTPEEQGIDSAQLVKMLDLIQAAHHPIHSMLIIRNGRLVMEAYPYPYDTDTLHVIMSCTKSVTSSLIGIALEQGKIANVSQRVLDFFPDRQVANLNDAKKGMTLENLLTMSGGFDWPGGMLESPILSQLWQSPNWVQFVLDRPLSDSPGSRFVYNSGGSHLLSAILQKSVGMTAEAFAKTNLFAPLGIDKWHWETDPQGASVGGWGLWLRPRDMAKFGYLYLNGGKWEDRQVVPASWVAASWQKQIAAGGSWLAENYGYQWWIDARGYYMALGYAGQYILIMPDRNLIMVTTSGFSPQDFFTPETLFNQYIRPASESSKPLPPNPDAVAALNERIAALARPDKAQTLPQLPETALRISGRSYSLEPSNVGWRSLVLNFTPGQDTAEVVLDGVPLTVGLDEVYRPSPPDPAFRGPKDAHWLLRGRWTNADAFDVDLLVVGRPERYTETLHFEGDKITMREEDHMSGQISTTTGQIVK
jgi:CubicO group peptidase (beta-lactamase class C family)